MDTTQAFLLQEEEAKVVEVVASRDYSTFHLDRHNRPISRARVERMKESIVNDGNFLSAYPIVVDSEMNIKDGQHRFVSASELGVYLYYITNDEINVEDIATINRNTKSWDSDDFLHHWAEYGIESYKQLQQYIASYGAGQEIAVSTAIKICGVRQTETTLHQSFKQGIFEFDSTSRPYDVRDIVLEVAEFFPDALRRGFVFAIERMSRNELFDKEVFLRNARQQQARLAYDSRTVENIEMLQSIYNHNQRREKRINFIGL